MNVLCAFDQDEPIPLLQQQQQQQQLHHATHRWVQADTTSTNSSSSSSNSTAVTEYDDAAVLRDTFLVYGSLLVVLFLAFCWARRRFPHAYQLRNWVPHIQVSGYLHSCFIYSSSSSYYFISLNDTLLLSIVVQAPLAQEQYGFFSWIWKLNAITEDEILTECGMDSLCVLRLLRMGYKIAFLSMLNALWLIPIYATDDSSTITDPVVALTIANLATGSNRLIGTVVAAYILFGYVMFLIFSEFKWFIEKRNMYLKRPVVENYAVYVRNIPPEYRSNKGIQDFFAQCFSEDAVLEAKLRIKAGTVVAAVKKRDAIVAKLEHALNYEAVKLQQPMHRVKPIVGERVPSIPFYTKELLLANDEVTALIEVIEQKNSESRSEGQMGHVHATEMLRGEWNKDTVVVLQGGDDDDDTSEPYVDVLEQRTSLPTADNAEPTPDDQANDDDDDDDNNNERRQLNVVNQGVNLLAKKTLSVAKSAAKLILQTGEGDFYPAGFVTFSSLGYTHAALQMVHHATPYEIEVLEAPRPDDIFWTNVGRSHNDLQVGRYLSLAATAGLCLLWTIPMTFIASLSSVEELSKKVKFLGDLIRQFPFLGQVFSILAPLLIKVVNALLPMILEFLTLFEGPVSTSVVVASLFTKLATFMIIQTFFVSALSSSLLQRTYLV
jgi:Late exocytosis, associated with Golgi transport/Calcium-dependent channel, 7TM region, putative phosphate/Cytosolic domain of 10TM putative phosphate transporter